MELGFQFLCLAFPQVQAGDRGPGLRFMVDLLERLSRFARFNFESNLSLSLSLSLSLLSFPDQFSNSSWQRLLCRQFISSEVSPDFALMFGVSILSNPAPLELRNLFKNALKACAPTYVFVPHPVSKTHSQDVSFQRLSHHLQTGHTRMYYYLKVIRG